MDFQTICRELGSRCEITGYASIVPGTSTGEHGKIVNFAADAWVEIQQEHEWNFLKKDFSFTTVDGQEAYLSSAIQAAQAPIRFYDVDTFRVYRTSIGLSDEQFLAEWAWEAWYDTYGYASQVSGRPALFAVRPEDNAIVLGPKPDAGGYTVRGKYWRQAQRLSAAGDVPIIDDEYHMVIVYKAMISYANREAAQELKLEAAERLDAMMSIMRRRYLPSYDSRESLA